MSWGASPAHNRLNKLTPIPPTPCLESGRLPIHRPLFIHSHGQDLQQLLQADPIWLMTPQNRLDNSLDDIQCKASQPEHATDAGVVATEGASQVFEARVPPLSCISFPVSRRSRCQKSPAWPQVMSKCRAMLC